MSSFVFDLTVSGHGVPTVMYSGLSVHQLHHVMARRPAGAEFVLRPRDTSKPTRKAGGRWMR
jgi:hypothetical protein